MKNACQLCNYSIPEWFIPLSMWVDEYHTPSLYSRERNFEDNLRAIILNFINHNWTLSDNLFKLWLELFELDNYNNDKNTYIFFRLKKSRLINRNHKLDMKKPNIIFESDIIYTLNYEVDFRRYKLISTTEEANSINRKSVIEILHNIYNEPRLYYFINKNKKEQINPLLSKEMREKIKIPFRDTTWLQH